MRMQLSTPPSAITPVIILLTTGSSTNVRYDQGMTEYIQAVLRYAKFEMLPGGACVATFPTLIPFRTNVYAHGDTIEQCAVALRYELESFVLLAVRDGRPLPEVDFVPPPSLETPHDSLVVDANR